MSGRGPSLRVLVCGGRDYQDKSTVYRELDNMARVDGANPLGAVEITIIHGDCPTGADRLADDWATINWCNCERYPADWNKHGKAAGPIRNHQMIDEGRPDIVIAFPGGRGTADMISRARRAGVPVREVS